MNNIMTDFNGKPKFNNSSSLAASSSSVLASLSFVSRASALASSSFSALAFSIFVSSFSALSLVLSFRFLFPIKYTLKSSNSLKSVGLAGWVKRGLCPFLGKVCMRKSETPYGKSSSVRKKGGEDESKHFYCQIDHKRIYNFCRKSTIWTSKNYIEENSQYNGKPQ